jgi:hypothetical protein
MLRSYFWSNFMTFVKLALAIAGLLPLASYAALGGAPSIGAASQPLLRSAVSVNPSASPAPYTMREAHGADGVTVHEYVLPGNVVFAVTWQGPVRPDMNALLGSYFPNFANTAAQGAHGAGPLIGRSGDVHIESAGRSGHFVGKAYLARLVPANVRVEQLQ